MKLLLPLVALGLTCVQAKAVDFDHTLRQYGLQVKRMPFGSGSPASLESDGTDHAGHVVDGLYHVPNYLPGHPTAATIWPREVPIECERDAAGLQPVCTGYRVHPAVGRGEYIFVRPTMKPVSPPPPPPPPAPEPPLPVTCKKALG